MKRLLLDINDYAAFKRGEVKIRAALPHAPELATLTLDQRLRERENLVVRQCREDLLPWGGGGVAGDNYSAARG